jgi:hypothetical protein
MRKAAQSLIFACLYQPFVFITPAHQQFGRQLCAAMPLQGVTLWRRAYVLLGHEVPWSGTAGVTLAFCK